MIGSRDSTVLSFSSDHPKLRRRASILKEHGFEVRSVSSPVQAQFEIEMGQCGIFITCPVVSELVTADLVRIFRKYCPGGVVVLIGAPRRTTIEAEIALDESDDPEIVAQAIADYLHRSDSELADDQSA